MDLQRKRKTNYFCDLLPNRSSRCYLLSAIAFALWIVITMLAAGCNGGKDGDDMVVSNQPPGAGFTADPTKGALPLMVTFDANISFDYDGTIVSYEWDFGDGTNGINWSSPAIISDGTLYIGGHHNTLEIEWAGKLMAIRTESYGLADSSWPKFRNDNSNTGRF